MSELRPGDRLRGHAELHVVEVTAYLLRTCRELLPALDRALQHRHNAGLSYGPYLDRGEEIVGPNSPDPEYLDHDQLEALAELLDAASDSSDLALRARDLATVIDQRRGEHFFNWFAGRQLQCGPHEALPIPSAEVVPEELGTASGLTPLPDEVDVLSKLGVPLDGTRRLRLCPPALGRLTVTFDGRHHGVVDTLFSGRRVDGPGPELVWAAVVPTCDLLADLTYDEVDADPPGFYRVRPQDGRATAYRARLLRGLDLARDQGAGIIVVPELSTDALAERDLEDWFAANRSVALMVAGSRHLDGPGEPRRNRARVLLRGGARLPPLVHDKFSYFSIELERGGVRRTELIERPNVLTIVAGRRWSFSALICKDFLEPTARRALTELRVRAVLVASMSPKTELYVTDGRNVAKDAQALVFVSNIPHGPKDHTAIFVRPVHRPPAECRHQAGGGTVATITTMGMEFQAVAID